MKFEHTNKGDTLFVIMEVKTSQWARAHVFGQFFIPCKVVHTTKTAFDLEVVDPETKSSKVARFHRESGCERKQGYHLLKAFVEGEQVKDFTTVKTAKDETQEYLEAINFCKKFHKLGGMIQFNICPKTITLEQIEDATRILEGLPLKE